MNEKSLKVLEQYEIEVTGTRRGRGSYICETGDGKKLLTDYSGSEKKIRFVNQVLEHLKEQGYAPTDMAIANKEGNLVSYDWEENAYLLKDWQEGRECDIRSMADIEQAVESLARLHKMMYLKTDDQEVKKAYTKGNLQLEWQRHNRELRKVYMYVKQRKQKNEFEVLFLENFCQFYDQALEAEEQLGKSSYQEFYEKGQRAGEICHGNYNYHNILFLGKREIFITNFDHCFFNNHVADLYQFLRKVMEKQEWSKSVGHRLLELYDRENHLGEEEMAYLSARLSYPEKFWKLANQYYNCGKSCIPWKNADKLKILIQQEKQKAKFLRSMQ